MTQCFAWVPHLNMFQGWYCDLTNINAIFSFQMLCCPAVWRLTYTRLSSDGQNYCIIDPSAPLIHHYLVWSWINKLEYALRNMTGSVVSGGGVYISPSYIGSIRNMISWHISIFIKNLPPKRLHNPPWAKSTLRFNRNVQPLFLAANFND